MKKTTSSKDVGAAIPTMKEMLIALCKTVWHGFLHLLTHVVFEFEKTPAGGYKFRCQPELARAQQA